MANYYEKPSSRPRHRDSVKDRKYKDRRNEKDRERRKEKEEAESLSFE